MHQALLVQNKTKTKSIDDPWHLPNHPPQSHIIQIALLTRRTRPGLRSCVDGEYADLEVGIDCYLTLIVA
ncbi:hypothetical protein BDN70DRAFT_530790 [Pholiota conissans]|uniref:Uncharacterized protein n=1 Tax=Pholiota conissans TaxID=109636 RepID=A0A9P5Z5K9_9AGAR|nr:hypothetical protein BDN70DRAFT_530790 [Pholiota conissans]